MSEVWEYISTVCFIQNVCAFFNFIYFLAQSMLLHCLAKFFVLCLFRNYEFKYLSKSSKCATTKKRDIRILRSYENICSWGDLLKCVWFDLAGFELKQRANIEPLLAQNLDFFVVFSKLKSARSSPNFVQIFENGRNINKNKNVSVNVATNEEDISYICYFI